MAPVLSWTEKYSVGVGEIDTQHKKIFQFINDLSCVLEQKENAEAVEAIIMEMIDYVVYHFRTEEKYLANHVDLQSHRRQHDIFTRRVLLYQETVVADPAAVGGEAVHFLTQWLQEHILCLDKKSFNDHVKKSAGV